MARLILGLFVLAPAVSHVFWANPPTRAHCFYDMPTSQDLIAAFRGSPCGRPSRGVLAAVVAGRDACVSFRMTIAHKQSSFRVSLAPGTAGTGGVQAGKPSAKSPFDDPSAVLATFECVALPGGCESDPGSRGDFVVPLHFPNSSAPGTYTLQLRQWAADLSWYYVSGRAPYLQVEEDASFARLTAAC